MSVWLTIPSARVPQEANRVLQKWRDQGYKIALNVDRREESETKINDLWDGRSSYPGYAHAVNNLIQILLADVPDAEWFVIGGDDTFPDPNKRADEIAAECREHFYLYGKPSMGGNVAALTFGVMQPTGDRYAAGQIDRICGSAWIGREFAKRAYKGTGPLWPQYTHMFVDEELQEVALKYGVLWQRPDLIQLHMQYCRDSMAIDSGAHEARPPAHITHDGYTPEHWAKYQKLFNDRKAAGFPGSELL